MFPAVTDLIPHRPPFLFVDEIIAESPDGVTARRTWRADEEFYKGHYPGSPITPGVILCESALQTAALFVARHLSGPGQRAGVPMVVKMTDVRFRLPVFPGDTTVTEVKLKGEMAGFQMLSALMKVGDKRVVTLEIAVTWTRPGVLGAA